MFRPVILQAENEYELVLMRNRREELLDVPIDYIESISFEMGERLQQPSKITLKIPSHIRRGDKTFAVPLFDRIKGKMQLRLKINGKYYMYSIEEESIIEAKDTQEKTIVAYEKQYKFNKVDFCIATDIATRQLYKTANETVEISDGMLNWFEQQTGWTVNRITDRAKSEVTMASEVARVDLGVLDTVVGTERFYNGYVDISANEGKPLNMKLVMRATVYDSKGNKYISQDLQFDFTNLPYRVKNIQAKYVSTNKNFYGVEFTLTYDNGNISKHEFPFVNCKNLRLQITDMAIEYELGNLVERNVTKYRTFDTTVTNWMAMLQTIADAFDVIILFDSYHESIDVCHREEFGELTNIALSYDNAIKEITKQRKLDELVTRLTVESSNTSIAAVNVLGTDYVECYDYFINNGIMSSELQSALASYNTLLEQKNVEFNQLLVQKHDADQALSLANSQLISLQSKYSTEKAILTGYLKTVSDEQAKPEGERDATKLTQFATHVKNQQAVVDSYEKQVEDKLAEVQTCKDNASSLETQLVKIGEDIRKENTGYFTDDLLKELNDYLIEKAITDDVHLTSYAVYDYTVQQIKQYQKPVIDFTISSSMEFIKRTGRKITDCLFLGAKMEIEDKSGEIASEDGTVMIYAFSICPKDDSVSNLKFMNGGKVPDSPLKQVSKVAQTVKATKSMTDFYKSTLAKIKDQNPDVAKLLEEGLDLASQKVRSRTEQNVIEIDEAGIFLIDAQDDKQQLALINDLIAMTTDKWKTCRVAISPEGIMAEELLGKIIIGEQLYLGNDTNSFKIDKDGNAYGMFMYSKKNDLSSLRVFLGIDKDNQPKLMFFDEGVYDFNNEEQRKQYIRIFLGVNEKNETTLIMKNEQSNNVVISPSGMFSCYQISDRDSFDKDNPFKSHFYIPNTLDNAFSAKLIVTLQPFRAYSKTAKSVKIPLESTKSTKIDLPTTEAGDIELTTTKTTSFKAESTKSGVDNIQTTETKSFKAESTGGSGTIKISLAGITNQAATVSGSGSAATSVYGEGGGGFSYRQTGAPLDGASGSPTSSNESAGHTHTVYFSHGHSVSVGCGDHTHTLKVTGTSSAQDHTHSFTVPTHSHGIKLPGHTHKFVVPTHDHAIEVPAHSHKITMPEHSHKIEMPEHDHAAIYGIYEETSIPNCSIYINGVKFKDLDGNTTGDDIIYEFDITSNFKALQSGVNILEFRTNGLARASFTMFWGGYYDYE